MKKAHVSGQLEISRQNEMMGTVLLILGSLSLLTLLLPTISVSEIVNGHRMHRYRTVFSVYFRIMGNPFMNARPGPALFSTAVLLSPYFCAVILMIKNISALNRKDNDYFNSVRKISTLISLGACILFLFHLYAFKSIFMYLRFFHYHTFFRGFLPFLGSLIIDNSFFMVDQLIHLLIWIISFVLSLIWIEKRKM